MKTRITGLLSITLITGALSASAQEAPEQDDGAGLQADAGRGDSEALPDAAGERNGAQSQVAQAPEELEPEGDAFEMESIEDIVSFQFGNVTEQGISYYVGGFVSLNLQIPFSRETAGLDPAVSHSYPVMTFDNLHTDLIVGANYRDLVLAEILLEWEHSGEGDRVRLLMGLLEWRMLGEALSLRAGTFLVPVGLWNSEYWPDYLNPVINRPFSQNEVVPVTWKEVGIAIRGRVRVTPAFGFRYDAYVVNGLGAREGQDLGLSPVLYRDNARDMLNPNKAFGARLGLQLYSDDWEELELGGSFYRGAYDPAGELFINYYAAHASFRGFNTRFLAEYVLLDQELSSTEQRDQWGFYALVGYRVWRLEPVVMYDMIRPNLDPQLERDRLTVGLNWFPVEDLDRFVAKATYAHTWNKGRDLDDDVVALELTFGF